MLLLFAGACGKDSGSRSMQPDAAADSNLVDAAPDGPPAVNGCTPALAVDLTSANADRTITVYSDYYLPAFTRIQAGQSITWVGDLGEHPLSPGIRVSGDFDEQPGNPIPPATSGSSHSVTFSTSGEWGFYCPSHPPEMVGMIYVVP